MSLMGIIGYLAKGWAENVITEMRSLRAANEQQLVYAAKNIEWHAQLNQWRDSTDDHFKDIDNRLDTLPWATRESIRRDKLRKHKQTTEEK